MSLLTCPRCLETGCDCARTLGRRSFIGLALGAAASLALQPLPALGPSKFADYIAFITPESLRAAVSRSDPSLRDMSEQLMLESLTATLRHVYPSALLIDIVDVYVPPFKRGLKRGRG